MLKRTGKKRAGSGKQDGDRVLVDTRLVSCELSSKAKKCSRTQFEVTNRVSIGFQMRAGVINRKVSSLNNAQLDLIEAETGQKKRKQAKKVRMWVDRVRQVCSAMS